MDDPTPLTLTTALLPCNECKMLRKKCDKNLPSCSRCIDRHVQCTYRTAALVVDDEAPVTIPFVIQADDPLTALTKTELIQKVKELIEKLAEAEAALALANERLRVKETSPIEVTSPASLVSLDSPGMAPSASDWILMSQYLQSYRYCLMGMNDPSFLLDYTNQPVSLRLIMCAIACLHMEPPLPRQVWIEYYNRARKALKREKNTEKHIIANLLVSQFTMGNVVNGHPILAEPYFFKAIRTMLYLEYTRDPDDIPSIAHLDYALKNQRRNIPKRVEDILQSPECDSVRTRLYDLRKEIPAHLILSQENLFAFTTTFKDRETVVDCFFTTLFHNVTLCIVNRPILYLTGFLTQDSVHLASSTENYTKIMNALFESVAAAQTVVGLASCDVQNFVTPLVCCIERMLEEMECSEKSLSAGTMDVERELDGIAIEMKVMSLSEDDKEVMEPFYTYPWVFLGLLGVEVNGTKWQAWYEEEWREFWNHQ
ncbi:UNVERIFIED_CONTAM: hypothetical protein HDU68_008291 [Siphonaria sp. JEL0065]|nr:hypothetical protein HDU68_008291 [Siphonaria sp. JEL0065]